MWGETTHDICIRFDARTAPYILEREWHPSQSIKRRRDGSIDLMFRASHLKEIRDWVMSWSPGACVTKPPELVALVRDSLQQALGEYPAPPSR